MTEIKERHTPERLPAVVVFTGAFRMYRSFACCYQGASDTGTGNDIYCSWCFYAADDNAGLSREAGHALAGLVYAS